MSLVEIEAELKNLTPDELRHLAIKSWGSFLENDRAADFNQCDEEDPGLLAALDKAIAEASGDQGFSGAEVHTRLAQWTSK